MSLLRSMLFDNLGLKFVALLLALLVYLNVYTDRPATMIVTFPIQLTDLADSLSLSGPSPAAVQAELRGTAKQLIRLRVTEPPVKVSLAGIGVGRYERALGIEDLPLPDGVQLQLDRLVSPRTLELQVDRMASRRVPVTVRIEGEPAAGTVWNGAFDTRPRQVMIRGPSASIATLDTVHLHPVALGGRRDTLRVEAAPQTLPDWCTMDPERVEITVPLEPGLTRRLTLDVEPPSAAGFAVTPARVTAVIAAPRRLADLALGELRALAPLSRPLAPGASRREPVRLPRSLPQGISVRFEPDSVTVTRALRPS